MNQLAGEAATGGPFEQRRFRIVSIAVFALLYRLGKRYWMGLLFVPALAYIAVSALILPLFYLPMFDIITLVE